MHSSEEETGMPLSIAGEARRIALRFVRLGTACLILITLVCLFTGGIWPMELATHFMAFWFAAALAGLGLLLLLKSWKWALAAAVIMAYYSAAIVPWYLPEARAVPEAPRVRILLANVLTSNKACHRFIKLALENDADILVLQEVDNRWKAALDAWHEEWPHSFVLPRSDNYGMAIYSRYPLEKPRIEYLVQRDPPGMYAKVTIRGRKLALLNTHMLPPVRPGNVRSRNRMMAAIPAFVKEQPCPLVIAGDLNCGMWTPRYKKMMRESGLVNARRGYGILPTWPAENRLLRVPIDHLLLSPELHVLSLRRGENFNSDHLPLILDVAIGDGKSAGGAD